jgi:4-diphosphocytidyl-2-C-methyl-D-erythritol kinase
MNSARVVAQAKINLRLVVLAREESGYHSIETIFHRVDLADDVVVRVGGSARSIDCSGADLGPAEKNLAYRAATLFAEATGWPDGFALEITKHIPVGGGMGGGSADAGAVLRALNELSPRPCAPPALRDLAVRLGADVPFMTTTDVMALAWGRGERLLALPALPRRTVVALVPGFSISTADAYRWIDDSRAANAWTREAWRKTPEQLADWGAVDRLAHNDFDAPVFAKHPELARLKQTLADAGARVTMLSGSGSTIVGLFDSPPVIKPAPGYAIISTVTTTSVHPVHAKDSMT